MRFRSALLLVALAGLAAAPGRAQPIEVTFRFLPDLTAPAISPVARAFVPGSFNDWGPNTSGRIQAGAPSQATYVEALNEYRYTTALSAGQSYAYKLHYHLNESGTAYSNPWPADPLNDGPRDGDGNSVVTVADPMVFQIAREQEGGSEVVAVSAGVFGTEAIQSVVFTVNGTEYTEGVTDTGDGVYRLVLPAPVPVGSFVQVTATDAASRTATASVGMVPPTVVDAPVPAGLEDGITVDPNDPTRAWLVLRAPGKNYVYALGDFNGWTASEDALMVRDDTDPLGTRWWIELTGLTPGREYPFQYWVGGMIRVADPYTTKVYYPGESGYPAGAQGHAVGVLQTAAPTFPWTDGAYVPPAPEDLVIYELLLRDFLRDHSFTTLADTLDYLQRLGVNAVQLMPMAEFDGDESWGYNPAFHLALDKYYGTPEELKAFVDTAHARGMAVILDVVYNHATGQSPLVRLYNEGDYGPPTPDNPYANVQARHPFNVFNDLNHESPLTQLWLDRANRFWVEEYHVDGYRFDLSKGFTQTCNGSPCTDSNFSAYNQRRIDILTRMADALWSVDPDTYVILEHFADWSEERVLASHGRDRGLPGMTLWSNMNHAYSESAMGYIDGDASLTRVHPPSNGFPLSGQVTYMESHDEQWLMYKNLAYGNSSGDYSVQDLPTALDRQKLAGAFFLTVPGPRMLWQFGEIGYGGGPGECLVNGAYPGECPSGVPDRVGNKPIRWDYWSDTAAPFRNGYGRALTAADAVEREQRQRLYRTWAALLDLRQSYDVFRSEDTEVTGRLGGVPDRWLGLSLADAPDGEPEEVVVVGNFGVTPLTVTPTFPGTGTWYEYFSDTTLDVTDPTTAIALAPGAYRIYTDVDVPSPRNLGAVAGEGRPGAGETGLQAVFPNPSAGRTTIRFRVAAPTDVRLTVFDVLGRRVATLAEGPQASGVHTVSLDGSRLAPGVYVVRLEAEGRWMTGRLTIRR